ncbi:MAG: VWA domain-containing protein [Propionibacteriaceae bacterium]
MIPSWLYPDGFEYPQRLAFMLLAPLGLVLYFIAMKLRKRSGMRFTNTAVLKRIMRPQRTWLRHVAVFLSLLAVIAVSVAYAIPYAKDRVPRERATVVVVIDTSLSMQATDVKPSRIDAAKEAAKSFVSTLPSGYNVAVVSLSGSPSVRLPPTNDHAAAARAIEMLQLQESTAVGEAIYAALDAISLAPKADDGSVAPAAIVMLSDGQNTAGRTPIQAAGDAKKQNVKIFTVAYGSANGYVDLDGKREKVAPDDELMQAIAKETGGDKLAATDAKGLAKAYESLKSKVGYEEVRSEVTARFAGLALVFALLAALATVFMGAKY